MQNQTEKFLNVNNLVVEYHSAGAAVHAVNDVSFSLEAGSSLGLVGETGAGKTTIAKTIMRILPDHAVSKVEGEVKFAGQDIMRLSDKEMASIRGKDMSMIFQDPMTALNPVKTVVSQVAESIVLHQKLSKQESISKAIKMLEMVGIAADRVNEYPHQFSGGMKQRAVIAIAIACSPQLLIADEPTTALDVTIQAQVLELIASLRKEIGMAMILITHDLGIVAEACDNVAVVYAGQIVEMGSKEDIFLRTAHPYTKGLFAALPDLKGKTRKLVPIEGLPPDPTNLPKGCAFSPRCPYADEGCRERAIDMTEIAGGHLCRCRKIERK